MSEPFRMRRAGDIPKVVQGFEERALNSNELLSVRALVAYAAHNQNISEKTVEAVVEARFRVGSVAALSSAAYDEAIRFLVDLRLDEIRN